ncbi:MAG: hypothetical protein EHM78_02085 [Myxococcaceae bacterium]|nr:MAG: hypothetical protein EHM78_02085 [Myxococcaceae bacterium]
MSNVENLVRPFLPGGVFPAGRTTKPEEKIVEDTVMEWGNSGSSVFQLSASNQNDVEAESNPKEERRKFDVARIKNKDDANQYVDVEVMTEYQGRNQIDKKRTRIGFSRIQPADNIEIIKRDQVRTTKDPA